MQAWPALDITLWAIAAAALVRSASAKTSCGLFPPSSSVIGLTPVRAILAMMAEPAPVEPVKLTLAMSEWPVRAVPVTGPSPSTILMRPAGRPARIASSAR
ncbi:hypothetical protein D9M70_548420 [compost metagenome]